ELTKMRCEGGERAFTESRHFPPGTSTRPVPPVGPERLTPCKRRQRRAALRGVQFAGSIAKMNGRLRLMEEKLPSGNISALSPQHGRGTPLHPWTFWRVSVADHLPHAGLSR